VTSRIVEALGNGGTTSAQPRTNGPGRHSELHRDLGQREAEKVVKEKCLAWVRLEPAYRLEKPYIFDLQVVGLSPFRAKSCFTTFVSYVVDGEVVQNTPGPCLRSFEVTHAPPALPSAHQRFLREILGYADVTSENDAKGDESITCFKDEVLEVSFQLLIFQAAPAPVMSFDDSVTICTLVGVAVEPRSSFHDMYTFKDRRSLRLLRRRPRRQPRPPSRIGGDQPTGSMYG
jgi:hypothetical protein